MSPTLESSGSRTARPPHKLAATLTAALLACLALGAALAAAPASALGPWWHLTSSVRPANIAPGGEGTLIVKAVNLGNEETSGPVTLNDLVPAGLKVQEEEIEGAIVPKIDFLAFSSEGDQTTGQETGLSRQLCSLTGQQVSCASVPSSAAYKAHVQQLLKEFGITVPPFTQEEYELFQKIVEEVIDPQAQFEEEFSIAPFQPYESLELRISVKDEGAASGAPNRAEVSGGGAPVRILERPVAISSEAPSFGVEELATVPEEEGGGVDTQAGSHPYQFTTDFSLKQTGDPEHPPALPRNLKFNLPAGFIGNATLLPQCSDLDFRNIAKGGFEDLCPADTVVGVASVTVFEPTQLGLKTLSVPLFNLAPTNGEPARFGFEILGAAVALDTSVRTGTDYGISASVSNITQLDNFISSTVTFWGVPGDRSHDNARGWSCMLGGHWTQSGRQLPCIGSTETHPAPFLTMPSSCSRPFAASAEGLSWTDPSKPVAIPLSRENAQYTLKDRFGQPLGISGCNKLAFDPSIEVQPDVSSASTPTGLSVHVKVPQEVSLGANGLASSSIKDTTLALPAGVSVSPSGADGLAACSEAQIGFLGIEAEGSPGGLAPGTDVFTPDLPKEFCPDSSKIGTVQFKVPVIAHPLEGSVYLAAQTQNPFGSLVAIYIVAEDKASGVLVKLAGEVSLSETGQLTTTFKNSPQAPLEEATFSFFGGARAPLTTPAHCGPYTTQATFTPWSESPPVSASSTFQITTGPGGGPCPGALPFAPSLAAGTTDIQAGAFSPLSTTITREDGNQDIQSVQLHLPPGLSGILAGIPLCPDAQANAGSCSPASQIGQTIVSVGLGGDPFTVTGGQVFLTQAYKGAPFGLSIVNPAKAGPFDLGKVIVRAKVEIDPHTAALTVSTDPIPHILQGIPLQIKHVNVLIDRPGFTFNPTDCSPLQLSGAISSVEGAIAQVQAPFQISNCAALKFAPRFAVSTNGRTSKANGASLSVKLSYPKAPFGTYANIAKTKVSLPKQLPSRLSTLQKACTAQVFDRNPANCPPASIVAQAKVSTPLLPVPLTGPAYFVSHGGEAFPDLTIVLKGSGEYNIAIDLVGSTQIKNGVTTTTFKAVPDAPFETFELSFPQGPHSALAANADLCRSKLAMPTEFVAQNGAVLRRSTPIAVSGCKKHRLTRHRRLLKALRACKRRHGKARAACVRLAHRRFGG
jgi:hypothetical protein